MTARRLAEFVCATETRDIGDAVLERATDLCISAMGAALLGSTTEVPSTLGRYLKDNGGVAEASAIGMGFRTTADAAAMLNCTASHATEYEDVSWPEGQYTCCLIPAMFSLGESLNANGQSVLEAIVVGFEVASRPATACGRDGLSRGFLGAACLGTLGVAAGAARLLRLDRDGVQRSLTLAASMAGGLIRQTGSTAHVLEAGFAARNGVAAAQLARRGLGGSDSIMTGDRGFFAAYTGQEDPGFALGAVHGFRIMAVGQKKYPCGYHLQRIVDGVLALTAEHRLSSSDIRDVAVHVNGAFSRYVRFDSPTNVEEARLSLYHVLSAALAWSHVDMRAFRKDALGHAELLAQRSKIRLVEHAEWGNDMIGHSDRIVISSTSGAVYEAVCEMAHGDAESPLTRAETVGKFLHCTHEVITPERQREIVERLEELRALGSVAPLMRTMAGLDAAA